MSEILKKISKTLDHEARELAIGIRRLHWKLNRTSAKKPIFVVGCSRAGTTLVYKTISESSEIGSLNRETHDFWTDLHPLKNKEWDSHALTSADASINERDFVSEYFFSRTGFDRWVDKNNQNGLCVPYLNALFPDAVYVFVKRSPADNISSLIEGWGRPGEFATWSESLPEKVDIDGVYKRWCFFVADGWRDYVTRPIEEICAFQYRAMNSALLAAKSSIEPARWIEIHYETILHNPVNAFRDIFARCDLSFGTRIEKHCEGVLEIPYNAFSEIKADKWREGKHAVKVERALPMVADIAAQLGY